MPNSLFCLLDWNTTYRPVEEPYAGTAAWVHAGHTLLLDGLWPACVTSQLVWLCWLVWDKQADPRSVRWDWGQHCGQAIPTSPSPNSEQSTFGASPTKGAFLPYQVRESCYVTSTLWPVQAPVSTWLSAPHGQRKSVRIGCLVLTEKLWQVFMVKDTLCENRRLVTTNKQRFLTFCLKCI